MTKSISGNRDFAPSGLRYMLVWDDSEGRFRLVVILRPFRAMKRAPMGDGNVPKYSMKPSPEGAASANDGHSPSHNKRTTTISPEGASYRNETVTCKKLYTHRFQHQAS